MSGKAPNTIMNPKCVMWLKAHIHVRFISPIFRFWKRVRLQFCLQGPATILSLSIYMRHSMSLRRAQYQWEGTWKLLERSFQLKVNQLCFNAMRQCGMNTVTFRVENSAQVSSYLLKYFPWHFWWVSSFNYYADCCNVLKWPREVNAMKKIGRINRP